jgi:hypothetical protein
MLSLIDALFAIALNGSTTMCNLSTAHIRDAVNGAADALKTLESTLASCPNDYELYGLYSAICFAWSENSDKRLTCASNLQKYEGDERYTKLGYAIFLHRHQYCGSSIEIIQLLSKLSVDESLLHFEVLEAAVRYGDYKAALKLADEYKRRGGEHLASAAQVLYHLGKSRYGDRLKSTIAMESKSLPNPNPRDIQFKWIENVVENKTNNCRFGRFYGS